MGGANKDGAWAADPAGAQGVWTRVPLWQGSKALTMGPSEGAFHSTRAIVLSQGMQHMGVCPQGPAAQPLVQRS